MQKEYISKQSKDDFRHAPVFDCCQHCERNCRPRRWPASVAESILFSAKGLIFVVKSATNGELLMEKFTCETKFMLSMKQFIYETFLL